MPRERRTITLEIGRSIQRFDRWLLAGLCALLMFGPLAFGAVQEWSLYVLEAGSVILALAWAVRQAASGRIEVRKSPLFIPLALFAGLIVVQLAFRTTIYSYATWHDALRYFSCGLLVFIAAQLLYERSRRRAFAIAMSMFGTAVAIFAMVQQFTWNGSLYWIYPLDLPPTTPVYGPYVSHNNYAGLMELLVPLGLGLAAQRSWAAMPRMLAGIGAVVMAATVPMSLSRGGTISLLIELLVFGALLGWTGRVKRLLPASAVSLLLLVGFVWYFGSDVVWHRLQTLEHTSTEPTFQMRVVMTGDTLRMFQQRPWLGWGLTSFQSVYPQFQSFTDYRVINEAHDDYAQLLAETGVLGFAIMVLFVALLYRGAARTLRSHSPDCLKLGALSACTGILVHSFVDFNLQIPANAAIFFVLAAMATAQSSPSAASPDS